MLKLLRPPVVAGFALVVAAPLVTGCAKQVAVLPPPVVATLPPPPAPVVAMPEGGYPGMPIPARFADGRYATPNANLSTAGATWHLRAALNVAALACRGASEARIVAGYNAMLAARKAELARAQTALSGEYKATGGAKWQAGYDDAMTRLYNFFSQSFARDAFCAQAEAVLAEAPMVPAGGFEGFAQARLATLEQPFTDFYRAYDAWAAAQAPQPMLVPAVVVAAAAAPPAAPVATPASAPVTIAYPAISFRP